MAWDGLPWLEVREWGPMIDEDIKETSKASVLNTTEALNWGFWRG